MKHIARKNLPIGFPSNTALLWWIACDYFKAPGWLYGVLGSLLFVWVLVFVIQEWKGEPVDLLKEEER